MSAEFGGAISLEAIEARRIGGLRGVRLQFKPGFNLVYGRNEAGKSTMRALVSFVLFGEIPSYLEASEPQGSVVLNLGTRKLFIERSLEAGKRAKPSRRLLIEEELGIGDSRFRSELPAADQNDAWMAQMLGGLTAGVFSDFYSISLEQMIASNARNSDVVRRIQEASVSGGGKSPSELADQLRSKARDLWPPRAADAGSINAMLKELDGVRGELRLAELDAAGYESLIGERDAKRVLIASIGEELLGLDKASHQLGLAERLAGVLQRRTERQRVLAPLTSDAEVPLEAEADISDAFDSLTTSEDMRAKVLARLELARDELALLDPANSVSVLEQRISALDRRREGVRRAAEELERAERQARSAEQQALSLQAAFGVNRVDPVGGKDLDALAEAVRLSAAAARAQEEMASLEGERAMHAESLTRARQSYAQALGRMGGFVSPAMAALSEPGGEVAYSELAAEVDAARRAAGDGTRLEREISARRREAEVSAARAGATGPRNLAGVAIALIIFSAAALIAGKAGTGAVVLAGAALVIAVVAVLASIRLRSPAGAARGGAVDLDKMLADRGDLEARLSRVLPSFGDFSVAQVELTGINENAARLAETAADCRAHEDALAEIVRRLEGLEARMSEAGTKLAQVCAGLTDPAALLSGNPESLPSTLGDLRWQVSSLNSSRASAEAARSEIDSFAADARELAVAAGLSAEGEPIELLDRLLERVAEVRTAAATVAGLEAELDDSGAEEAKERVAEIASRYGIADRSQWRDHLERRSERQGLERELRAIGDEEAMLRSELDDTPAGSGLVAEVESGLPLDGRRTGIEERKADLTAALSSANQELGGLEQRIQDLGVDARMAEANAHAAALRADIARTFADWAAYALAEQMLREGISRFGQERSRGAAELASELFAELTKGRYAALELNDDQPWVRRADGAELKLESLSRGTLDLAYLATRFAVAEVNALETPQGPLGVFMLLDDVLVNHDRERAREVVRLLLRTSRRKQVIFMTCHEHLVGLVQQESANDGANMPTMLDIGA